MKRLFAKIIKLSTALLTASMLSPSATAADNQHASHKWDQFQSNAGCMACHQKNSDEAQLNPQDQINTITSVVKRDNNLKKI